MLEDLKPEITALQGRLAEMEKALDVAHKEEKIAELEYKMGGDYGYYYRHCGPDKPFGTECCY